MATHSLGIMELQYSTGKVPVTGISSPFIRSMVASILFLAASVMIEFSAALEVMIKQTWHYWRIALLPSIQMVTLPVKAGMLRMVISFILSLRFLTAVLTLPKTRSSSVITVIFVRAFEVRLHSSVHANGLLN